VIFGLPNLSSVFIISIFSSHHHSDLQSLYKVATKSFYTPNSSSLYQKLIFEVCTVSLYTDSGCFQVSLVCVTLCLLCTLSSMGVGTPKNAIIRRLLWIYLLDSQKKQCMQDAVRKKWSLAASKQNKQEIIVVAAKGFRKKVKEERKK